MKIRRFIEGFRYKDSDGKEEANYYVFPGRVVSFLCENPTKSVASAGEEADDYVDFGTPQNIGDGADAFPAAKRCTERCNKPQCRKFLRADKEFWGQDDSLEYFYYDDKDNLQHMFVRGFDEHIGWVVQNAAKRGK